jgi:hypothetical protein
MHVVGHDNELVDDRVGVVPWQVGPRPFDRTSCPIEHDFPIVGLPEQTLPATNTDRQDVGADTRVIVMGKTDRLPMLQVGIISHGFTTQILSKDKSYLKGNIASSRGGSGRKGGGSTRPGRARLPQKGGGATVLGGGQAVSSMNGSSPGAAVQTRPGKARPFQQGGSSPLPSVQTRPYSKLEPNKKRPASPAGRIRLSYYGSSPPTRCSAAASSHPWPWPSGSPGSCGR